MSVMDAATVDSKVLLAKSPTKHGYHGTRTYSTWQSMHYRCEKKVRYLRLGIKVCEHWNSFENFLEDMGERPDGMTLDRRDGKLGYFKENCRWATPAQQSQNLSSNVNITAFGKTQCVAEWARELGVNYKTIHQRLDRGYTPEKALTAGRFEWVNRSVRSNTSVHVIG